MKITPPSPIARLDASMVIRGSPSEVWAVLGDFEDVETWAPGLTRSHRTTGSHIDVGSRRTVTYRHLFAMEQVVTEWSDGRRLTYAVFRAPWPLRNVSETWTVAVHEGGCLVTTELAYDLWLGWVGRVVHWLFTRHVLRFEVRMGQLGLKRVVESGGDQADVGIEC
jgi:hypothetical protein